MAITDGLISRWSQNNDWVDDVNGYNGSATGSTFDASGKLNQAGTHDGVDDYVDMGDVSGLELQTFTMAIWAKRKSTGAVQYIYSNQSQAAWVSPTSTSGIAYRFGSGNVMQVIFAEENTDPLQSYSGTTSVADTNWHLVIATKTGTSFKLYLDDPSSAEITQTLGDDIRYSASHTPKTSLASIWNDDISSYNGLSDVLTDEIVVWDRVLSASELSELWNGGTGVEIELPSAGNPTVDFTGMGKFVDGLSPNQTKNVVI